MALFSTIGNIFSYFRNHHSKRCPHVLLLKIPSQSPILLWNFPLAISASTSVQKSLNSHPHEFKLHFVTKKNAIYTCKLYPFQLSSTQTEMKNSFLFHKSPYYNYVWNKRNRRRRKLRKKLCKLKKRNPFSQRNWVPRQQLFGLRASGKHLKLNEKSYLEISASSSYGEELGKSFLHLSLCVWCRTGFMDLSEWGLLKNQRSEKLI